MRLIMWPLCLRFYVIAYRLEMFHLLPANNAAETEVGGSVYS